MPAKYKAVEYAGKVADKQVEILREAMRIRAERKAAEDKPAR